MRIPRNLSGKNLAKMLCREWNYVVVHQTGSHIILDTEIPSKQRIVVPAHKALRVGTLNGILRSVASHKNVLREDILSAL